MTDTVELAENSVPQLVRGVRVHFDKARDEWVLLAPERTLKLDGIAAEILKRVDGERSLGAMRRSTSCCRKAVQSPSTCARSASKL